MSTTWTITASDMIRGALELNSAIGATEAVTAEDSELCLRALNGIIKEMPLHGLAWPQLSSVAVAVTWSALSPSKVTQPADYFGVPVLKYTASGKLVDLIQIPKPAFELLDLTQTAEHPTHFYVAPDNSFNLWPVPTVDPVLKLTYQAIADDASLTIAPDVQQQYLNLFELWIGDKVSLKFETPAQTRMEINARFKEALERMKQWAVDLAPLSFEVVG